MTQQNQYFLIISLYLVAADDFFSPGDLNARILHTMPCGYLDILHVGLLCNRKIVQLSRYLIYKTA